MYEFFGWFSLNHTTTGEGDDPEVVQATAARLAPFLDPDAWPTSSAELRWHNGELYLVLSGLVNRRRFEAEAIDAMLDIISRDLPGSYGLLYERDDERTDTPGPDAFAVRRMAKGRHHQSPRRVALTHDPDDRGRIRRSGLLIRGDTRRQ
jgi:hypothetical protein